MNYRTNIYGALLTNPEVFNVVIESAFLTPDNNVEITWDGTATKPEINNDTKEITVDSPSDLAYIADIINNDNYPEGTSNGLEGYTITLNLAPNIAFQNKRETNPRPLHADFKTNSTIAAIPIF